MYERVLSSSSSSSSLAMNKPSSSSCWRQMSTPRGPAPPGASPLVSPRCALVEDDSTLLPQYCSQEG